MARNSTRHLTFGSHTNEQLTLLGKRHGKAMYEKMAERYPDGFLRIDSLIHGWAMGDPKSAVDWFNELPETFGSYSKSLHGLIWGLGVLDGAMAASVVENLPPADRSAAIYPLASSIVHEKGLAEFDAWTKTVSPELAKEAVGQATSFALFKSPSEYVPWFANHSSVLGMPSQLHDGFRQWFAAEPTSAMDWLAEFKDTAGTLRPRLFSKLKPSDLERFAAKNPNHPIVKIWKEAGGSPQGP